MWKPYRTPQPVEIALLKGLLRCLAISSCTISLEKIKTITGEQNIAQGPYIMLKSNFEL
jgi:hypothetical protein